LYLNPKKITFFMKNTYMKKICASMLLLMIGCYLNTASGQLIDRLKNKVKQRADQKTDQAVELSRKRADAVKKALSDEFRIDASRMQTDGLGETKPVGDNKTNEGKAQNRRVEFVKI
jgi:hypothetical protein